MGAPGLGRRAAALLLPLLLLSCASLPPSPPKEDQARSSVAAPSRPETPSPGPAPVAAPVPADPAAGGKTTLAAPPGARKAATAATMPDFGTRSLAALSRRTLPGNLELLLWDSRGRSLATALLFFEARDGAGSSPPPSAPALDLALALLGREAAAASGDPSLRASLVEIGGGEGLIFEGQAPALASLLVGLGPRLAAPAFLSPDFPEASWQAALAELRVEALRKDPSGRGRADYFGLDPEAARLVWRELLAASRARLVLSADRRLLEAEPSFAAAGALPFSPMPRRGSAKAMAAKALLADYLGASRKLNETPWSISGAALAVPASLLGGSASLPAASELEAARTRSLGRLFGPGRALLAMAQDLASGGDGSLPFLLASALEACGPADLAAAAKELGVSLR